MEKEICKWYYACPIVNFVEQGRLSKRWVEDYCFRGGKSCKRYEMEEKGIYHPDNMLPDGTINKNLE